MDRDLADVRPAPPAAEVLEAAPIPLSESFGPVYEDSPNRPIRKRVWMAVIVILGLTVLSLGTGVVIGLYALFAS